MKKLAFLLSIFFVFTTSLAQETTKNIFGTVYHMELPVAKVEVSVVGKENQVITDFDGKYSITCEVGDKLQFKYPGLKTITIKVEDVTRVLNPTMFGNVMELDEVTVKASRRKSQKELEQEYPYNKNIIRTAFEYLDTERTPGFIQFMNEDEIMPIGICILDALRSQFAAVRVIGDCNRGGNIFFRSRGSLQGITPAIYDIDGVIFTDAPIWLNIGNIKRIALLRNLNQTVLYGNIASGGVVVINTVAGHPALGKIVDRAKLRHNFINEKVLSQDEVMENMPDYMATLEGTVSFNEAKTIYKEFNKVYSGFPYFQLDAFRYFNNKWKASTFADELISKNYRLFENNAVLLKALAYSYEEQERFDEANSVYREVFIARPNYAQSYMDMANSYRNIGREKLAAGIYTRYQYLLEKGFMVVDSVGFIPIINREYNNLLALHKDEVISYGNSTNLYVAEEDFDGTRLVFEWNDGEAEFHLQFVNPAGQYYQWKHSLEDIPKEIHSEKDMGYNVKEYLVDSSLPGTWKVNAKYLGNKSLSPTYLKTTVYYNYGSKNQTKETKVFRLSLKNINQGLFHLHIRKTLATE